MPHNLQNAENVAIEGTKRAKTKVSKEVDNLFKSQPKSYIAEQPGQIECHFPAKPPAFVMLTSKGWEPYVNNEKLLQGDDIVIANGDVNPRGQGVFTYKGNDIIYGSAYSETIDGGEGNDRIYGRGGINRLYGELGDDWYVYEGVGTHYIRDCKGHNIIEYPENPIDRNHFFFFENYEKDQGIFCIKEHLLTCKKQFLEGIIIEHWSAPECRLYAFLNETHVCSLEGSRECQTRENLDKAHKEKILLNDIANEQSETFVHHQTEL